ncbi:type IV secretory system conjugative DNA transfer family protein [Flavobacterium sp. 3HN19-14]|uniref:type IV secretory system conjugative DNA transfer family protein n=1 Tax=Flavobacterium sp. 3HN19-14 TaxID=3448133 RepID=UPI003EE0263F
MNPFDLDRPLLNLSGKDVHGRNWTIGDAVEGVQIFGGIGSGKTSGSGRTLALKYLQAGFGGLVLTVKTDEKELWEKYCIEAGRMNDLIIVDPKGNNFYNLLDFESQGETMTGNIVEYLKTVIRASEEKSSGSKADPFWENSLDLLVHHVIDLCRLAYGEVSVQRMYDIVQTIPKQGNQYGHAKEADSKRKTPYMLALDAAAAKARQLTREWQEKLPTSEMMRLQAEGTEACDMALHDAHPEVRLFDHIDQFFLESYVSLAEKTRSIIDFSFSNFLFRLLQDPVYRLFCRNKSNFTPESSRDGKIILLNLPVKKYHKIGRDSQVMFKFIWQRAMEKSVNFERPVFLWADEAQNFIHEHDPDFQATARSKNIATVYISQNLPNYLANMGSAKSEDKVHSFLGTLNTKLFHANADIQTNRYASDLIGDAGYEEKSSNSSIGGSFNLGQTRSFRIDKLERPERFMSLKNGGRGNNGVTEAIMHVLGKPIAPPFNYALIPFNQNFTL